MVIGFQAQKDNNNRHMTIKHLFLLRHAKSSWDDPSLDDFDRPLNDRGKKAAPLMGRIMRERDVQPDLILCSTAKRTKQTAKLVAESAKLKSPIVFTDEIYEASTEALLDIIKAQEASVESILMIGHNPGLSELLMELTGEYEHFPTAALAKVALEVDKWKSIKGGAGQLKWILRPKELS